MLTQALRRTLGRRKAEREIQRLIRETKKAAGLAEGEHWQEAGRLMAQIAARALEITDKTLAIDPAWIGAERTLDAAKAAREAEQTCTASGWFRHEARAADDELRRNHHVQMQQRNVHMTLILLQLASQAPESLHRGTIVLAATTGALLSMGLVFTITDRNIDPDPANAVLRALTAQSTNGWIGWLAIESVTSASWLMTCFYLAIAGPLGKWRVIATLGMGTIALQAIKLTAL